MLDDSASGPVAVREKSGRLFWVRLLGAVLALFGAWSVYGLIGAWRLMETVPLEPEMQPGFLLEHLFACAFLVFGSGMLARRRWAWIGSIVSLVLPLSMWTTTGLASIIREIRAESASDFVFLVNVGVILPVAIGFLVLRFLLSPSTRACFDAGVTRMRPWLLGSMTTGAAVSIALFTLSGDG